MGTRADFYIGRDPATMEWLGSIAWDGYPDGIPSEILYAETSEDFAKEVEIFLKSRDDATFPNQGWPWPWKDSCTTDFAYAFADEVFYTIHGPNKYPDIRWWRHLDKKKGFHSSFPTEDDEDFKKNTKNLPKAVFPDMTEKQKVTLGKRSGVLIFTF